VASGLGHGALIPQCWLSPAINAAMCCAGRSGASSRSHNPREMLQQRQHHRQPPVAVTHPLATIEAIKALTLLKHYFRHCHDGGDPLIQLRVRPSRPDWTGRLWGKRTQGKPVYSRRQIWRGDSLLSYVADRLIHGCAIDAECIDWRKDDAAPALASAAMISSCRTNPRGTPSRSVTGTWRISCSAKIRAMLVIDVFG
jgi:hypothetical protein